MCLVCGLNSEKREHLVKTASGSDKVTIKNIAKAKGEFNTTSHQTSEMDPFARTFNRLELLTTFAEKFTEALSL